MTFRLNLGPSHFTPALAIFDKDGTLIDFDAMWDGWIVELARRLETAVHLHIRDALFDRLGFDPAAGQALPGSPFAVAAMGELRQLSKELLLESGLSPAVAEAGLRAAWHAPDPVALARPLADLPALFGTLRDCGLKIAVATTDDRDPTSMTLAALGVASFVDAMACGDDGPPIKPAPDMVLSICRQLRIPPSDAMVIGDTTADMQMGRAAGAGLLVGVLSGVSPAVDLTPLADVVLPSVGNLLEFTHPL